MRQDDSGAAPFIRAAAVASGVVLASHIYGHLGDYTSERGILALLQIAAIASAFGAMTLLVLETARHAFERINKKNR